MQTPIFGPFDVTRSPNFADNRLINLYPEVGETKDGKGIGALYGTPGLDLLTTLGAGPIRGMHVMGNTLYVASGADLYSIDTHFVSTNLGGIRAFGAVSMIDNGTQLAVFAGAEGFLTTGGAISNITLPFASGPTPIRATYQDGFGIINQPGSGFIFQSDLLDLSSWPALQFGESSGNPDNVVTVQQIIREIWVIKELHSEIWYNAGTPNFAFALLPGPYLEVGIEAVESLARNGQSLYWLAKNTSGERIVAQTMGHEIRRISTHALEAAIDGYSTVSDANGYCYQQGGHAFYVLNFPTGDATWVYDITASTQLGFPVWHQRAALLNGVFHRHWTQHQASFAGKIVVGDYRNGNLYALNLTTLTDNGAQRKWLRSWRALQAPSEQPVRFNSLRIDMQTGIGVAADANPQAMLRWSDDGGHIWSNEHLAAIGKIGETAHRVMYRRLGATRRNSGLDRIFELSSSDPCPVAVIGAELDAA